MRNCDTFYKIYITELPENQIAFEIQDENEKELTEENAKKLLNFLLSL